MSESDILFGMLISCTRLAVLGYVYEEADNGSCIKDLCMHKCN